MGNKIAVQIMVDDEVKGACDALVDVCKDIKAKAAAGQYLADLVKDLSPALGNIASLGADVKANPDNRKYIAMALEAMADVFLFPQA